MEARQFGFALCNEIYGTLPLEEVCQSVRGLGYEGIELAPHTLAVDASIWSSTQRASVRDTIAGSGLAFVGLHWLLVSPPGLHVTTSDVLVRRRSWDYVHRAIDLCGELAVHGQERRPVMVFGSPKQRSTTAGISRADALAIFTAEMSRAAPLAEAAGVTLLVEAIPSVDTDVINTLADAAAVVEKVDSLAVQTMFDVHNTADETIEHSALLREYRQHIRHVHVNEMNGQEPGMGTYDLRALFRALSDIQYTGWVSVEAFDFSRAPEEIARRAMESLSRASAS